MAHFKEGAVSSDLKNLDWPQKRTCQIRAPFSGSSESFSETLQQWTQPELADGRCQVRPRSAKFPVVFYLPAQIHCAIIQCSRNLRRAMLIFQIGTNNWQRQGEFAPGSGILHASFHDSMNNMPGVKSYSIYPSKKQTNPEDDPTFRVFKIEHDIPICESVSPNSSYRWHSMTEEQYDAYLKRLENEICQFMDEVEAKEGKEFDYLISHHAFTNAMTAAQIVERRHKEGKTKLFTPLLAPKWERIARVRSRFRRGATWLKFAKGQEGQDVVQCTASLACNFEVLATALETCGLKLQSVKAMEKEDTHVKKLFKLIACLRTGVPKKLQHFAPNNSDQVSSDDEDPEDAEESEEEGSLTESEFEPTDAEEHDHGKGDDDREAIDLLGDTPEPAEKVDLTVKPSDQTELRRSLLPKKKKKDQKKPGETKKDQKNKKKKKSPKKSAKGRGKGHEEKGAGDKSEVKGAGKVTSKVKKVEGKGEAEPSSTGDAVPKRRRGRPSKKDSAPSDPSAKPGSPDETGASRVYGCSRCRYAAKGCKTCKNPNFKPRARRSTGPGKGSNDQEGGEDVD
eukprot:s858_g26.t1